MKIVCISDTHRKLYSLGLLPEGDILIHAGDMTSRGGLAETMAELDELEYFAKKAKYRHVLVISGNHDFLAQKDLNAMQKLCSERDLTYLQDESVTIDEIKFYGSPYTPEFFNWAFMKPRNEIHKVWDKIPADTDVLITHGPPLGILDKNIDGEPCGDEALLDAVQRVKPKYHIFGHIHQSSGILQTKDTIFVNAAILDDRYIQMFMPRVINYETK